MRRNATEIQLRPKQRRILTSLLNGESVTNAAAQNQVSRATIHRWLNEAAFRTAFDRGIQEIKDTAGNQLLALADSAVAVVATSLANGDPRTSLALLKGIGLLAAGETSVVKAASIETEWGR